MPSVDLLYVAFPVLVTLLAGLAYLLMGPTPADYQKARTLLWAASILSFGIPVMYGATVGDNTPVWLRLAVVGMLGAFITIVTDETMRVVTARENAAAAPATPAITTTRQAFSTSATINSLPPFPPFDGVETFDVAHVAVLKLTAPYSPTSVTLSVNAIGVQLPDQKSPTMQVSGLTITTGERKLITLDTGANKTQVINEGGRNFLIALTGAKVLSVPSVTNPLEWTFNISEQ